MIRAARFRTFVLAAAALLASAVPARAGFTYSTRIVSGDDRTALGGTISLTPSSSPTGVALVELAGPISIATQNFVVTENLVGGSFMPLLEVTITDTETGASGFIDVLELTAGTVSRNQNPGNGPLSFNVLLDNSAAFLGPFGPTRPFDLGNGRVFQVAVNFSGGGVNSNGQPEGDVSGVFPVGFRATRSLDLVFTQVVPEPSSLTLCGLAGVLGLIHARRRRPARSS